MKLGKIVKDYRTSQRLSMGKFAKLANLSKAYISMLEKGENPATKRPISPSLETIQNIAHAMNVDFEFLISQIEGNQMGARDGDTSLTVTQNATLKAINDKVGQLHPKRQKTVLKAVIEQLEEQLEEEEQGALE
ncbi:helix-turn-helix domain-containing protein [Streptococcus sciuri]|uniref:Helix-turn-helix domain-containing protein n=1 Tax=Streptococcus sciuri TaxID=2973939 RepID=A0ABT2F7K1_9STRE|nr:helix-turn-helix transcriptional regulator [Streptococcus sciuri]MCS4488360.1 helix-turn-helix domain-containing protein [Streptococcus sciuri]